MVESGVLCTWTGELENGSETVSSLVELETIFILESLGAAIPDNLTLHLNSALKGESVDGAKLEQLLLGKPADDLRGLQGQAGAG
jgi:hypothetical protein